MADHNALIARAHAGKRVAEFMADPEVNTAYAKAVHNLEKRILGFDPKDTQDFAIARSMLLGLESFWDVLGGIVARGKDAEAEMAGQKKATTQGRVL
jgi:hypothetical protein